tara:strand:+ start:97 stop:528 length:432 start_codon:yes stop_codon:yes gene_type:complete
MNLNKGVNMKFKFHDGGRSNTPFQKKTKLGDCVIRALTLATKLPYQKVWEDLCELSKFTGMFPNHHQTYEIFLAEHGWIKQRTPRDKNKKMISIEDWSYKDAAVISVSSHLVFLDRKTIYDTWDCRDRKIQNYYISHNIPGIK